MSEQLAYLAGFLDGEGSIDINWAGTRNGKRYHKLRVRVSQVNPKPLGLFLETFGGSIRWEPRRNNSATNHKPIWSWEAQSRIAANTLIALMPYLIIKKDEAQIGLEFQSRLGSGLRITPDEQFIRAELALRLQILKKRDFEAYVSS